MIFIQYRGKVTEDYARVLHRIKALVTRVLTLRKLKTTMPSLKPKVEVSLRAGVVYQITCPCCRASYVQQSRRHRTARFREHIRQKGTIGKHLSECEGAPATITIARYWQLACIIVKVIYSETSLRRTPLGNEKVSVL